MPCQGLWDIKGVVLHLALVTAVPSRAAPDLLRWHFATCAMVSRRCFSFARLLVLELPLSLSLFTPLLLLFGLLEPLFLASRCARL